MVSTKPTYNSMLERRRYLVTQQCTTSFAQLSIFGSSSYFAMDLYPSRRDGNSDKFLSPFSPFFFIKCQTPCT